ncbi:2-keto-4-pentenoate hydratase/2-oxohepta-3-ene-1,7-dioic acid hydratase (catechol pathway) [bacterium A37T11]|nr:2-keto-4-pentenoate hydratase/2-oxohepta-3-ene-1,7-dioic acid hydratase (catechol pathway) [bacterium A37T11]
MKIVAVGRNYAGHAMELNNPVPQKPVIFLKPDTALIKNNKPFFYPDFSTDIHYELEVVLHICKEGKHVNPKFAANYYDAIGLGIDFTARDIQQQHKEKGLPWELAKAFDHSAPVSQFFPKADFKDLYNLDFHLVKNGETVQRGNTKDVLFTFEQLIVFVSTYITLRTGDLLFTGTPAGVGPIKKGDHLTGYLQNEQVLEVAIK